MKVLQFLPSLNASDGGTTTYMQQLAAVLGQKCELHVCALTPKESFVPLSHCRLHSLPLSLLKVRQIKNEWLRLLDEINPDVVHINCCWMPQIALVTFWTQAWRKHHNRELKLFLTPHGMLEPWILKRNYWTKKLPAIWLYQRKGVALCDRIIATAEEERQNLLQLGWNSHVDVVENGIDVAGITPKTIWNKPKELLFMSRIHPKKGIELLFEALAQILPQCTFHLTIAGMGDPLYIDSLQKKAAALQIRSHIDFVGAVYGEQKWALLRQSDALVLPTYSENYGLVVAEALASATPVLTTTGTPWRIIQDRHCGWWTNPTVEDIANSLISLSQQSESDMECMGKEARRLAEQCCSIEEKVCKLYKLYLSK